MGAIIFTLVEHVPKLLSMVNDIEALDSIALAMLPSSLDEDGLAISG